MKRAMGMNPLIGTLAKEEWEKTGLNKTTHAK